MGEFVISVSLTQRLEKIECNMQAVTERVTTLATIAGEGEEAPGPQPAKLGDSDFRQGVRRATWVGAAWMPTATEVLHCQLQSSIHLVLRQYCHLPHIWHECCVLKIECMLRDRLNP